ncbi:MAG: 3-dehydroquinate synthase [Oscillospiraceae bacterium]|nr:3-dehydroquinate synthase [Oscillospiraceae bacterium]
MILTVSLPRNAYDVVMERGCLQRAGAYLKLDRKVLVVTDDGVPAEYAAAAASQCGQPSILTVPAGEQSKSFETLQQLLAHMLERDFDRGDCVLAVGGGVVGDLAGFAASMYMRGIDFYNIPTTLLSQVDSSIGGKTAVNFGGIKNTVGAIWQPKRVLVDPDLLKTLPARQITAGLAEALKESLTSDAALFRLFEEDPMAHLEVIIAGSLKIKADVVAKDERETGLRRILNFGQTIGHGIESCQDLSGLYHGECVALGMIPMCAPEVRARLLPVLKKLNLPVRTDLDPERIYEAMHHDKKAQEDGVLCVYVDEIGSCRVEKTPYAALRDKLGILSEEGRQS